MLIEADCWEFISALNNPVAPREDWRGLVEEIRAAFGLLPEWRTSKTRTECNEVEHELTMISSRAQACVVWRHRVPQMVRSLVQKESRQVPTSDVSGEKANELGHGLCMNDSEI